jgi:hypothetical protein
MVSDRDVYRYEGPAALFRGLGPTLVGVVPGRFVPSRSVFSLPPVARTLGRVLHRSAGSSSAAVVADDCASSSFLIPPFSSLVPTTDEWRRDGITDR